METVEQRPLMRATEAAERLNVSVWSVRRLVKRGVLTPVRLHPTAPFRFEPEDVEALIDRGRAA
jgi:excisionase family DNA binding protein